MNINELYSHYQKHGVVSTDTRNIVPNCIFFALKGDTFDANQYASQAIEKGASFAIIDNAQYRQDDRYIVVENVLNTLQDLARLHRQQLSIPFIGITGSNGKTTTKELVNAVLSQHYKTFATVGNLNNHIGVPLTILSIGAKVEVAIIEMGANHQREIEFLCSICQPTHGIITNIGKSHLEGFGGLEGVIRGKSELYEHLKKAEGVAFINCDNSLLMQVSQTISLEHTVYYGTSANSDVRGELSTSTNENALLELKWEAKKTNSNAEYTVKSNLTGAYNFENILAAICVGNFFGLSAAEITKGVESYQPRNHRSQLVKTQNNTLICDYYNANPTSMSAALENLANINDPNKVMILGDMFELGADATKEHEAIVQKASQIPAKQRVFIGNEFYKYKDSINQYDTNQFYPNTQEALKALGKSPIKDATILVKGSRGMKLETLVDLL